MRRTLATALVLALGRLAIADDATPPPDDSKPKQDKKDDKQVATLEQPSTQDSLAVSQTAPANGVDVGDTRFELHGYARMPLSTQGTREPYLVDNDPYLSGFAYTRLYEHDWSELYFSARHGDYKAEFGLFASQYSDASLASITNQLGLAQASVTAQNFLDQQGLSVQMGVFWDRYGYLEPYDTYIYGRTHQGGVKVKYELPGGARVQGGVGFHDANLQQNQGLTPLLHVAAAYPIGPIEIGTYALRVWTDDKRQLSPIASGTMYVAGADARYKFDRGSAYAAFGYYHMDNTLYLAPALEVMSSTSGLGLTQDYLGTDSSKNGSGHMYTLATDNKYQVSDKIFLRGFGMVTWVRSPQIDEMDPLHNKDRRLYLKWGIEPSYHFLPKLVGAVRYDRVILDMYDSQDSFHVLSPRLIFPLEHWGELFIQYSHYWYGDKITLRPGQVELETMPDSDVFKLQAQVVW
jgi:hypothetical protein